ncbi:MAG: amino acid ABC transporter permease [Clostridia bacterium]|nr:amino acid ABC transporter permease [Clostridia bacterium]
MLIEQPTFWEITAYLLEGFWATVKIFGMTLLTALPLGLIIAFGSMSKFSPLKWFVKGLVWIIRGTPLMLQLIVIYYGPGILFDVQVGSTYHETATYITFTINYACYFSEIYRGGIEGIPRGQYEACQVLGMNKIQTFFRVVLMQVVKRIIPPMSNEIITLVKDTAIARIIGYYEIIHNAQYYAKNVGLIWPLFYTGAFYLVFCGLLTILFSRIEKKLSYYKV